MKIYLDNNVLVDIESGNTVQKFCVNGNRIQL